MSRIAPIWPNMAGLRTPKTPARAALKKKRIKNIDRRRSFGQYAFCRGAVAQLGERLNGIQEAVSSILSSSTRQFKNPRSLKNGRGFLRVQG